MARNFYEVLFLKALGLTSLIEITVFCLVYYFGFKKKKLSELLYGAFVCFIASALTLPYVWFVFPAFITEKIIYIIAAEIFALIVEAVVYRILLKCRAYQAFIISFICNGASFGLGLLIFR